MNAGSVLPASPSFLRSFSSNLFVGVGVVHLAGIAAALLKLIGPIEAAMIHLGPDILVFVNSVKLLRVRIPSVRGIKAGAAVMNVAAWLIDAPCERTMTGSIA